MRRPDQRHLCDLIGGCLPIALKAGYDQNDHARHDARVGDVGHWPIKSDFWNPYVDEVGDIALPETVDDIAERATHLQPKRHSREPVVFRQARRVVDDQRCDDRRDDDKKDAAILKQAERRTEVLSACKAEPMTASTPVFIGNTLLYPK